MSLVFNDLTTEQAAIQAYHVFQCKNLMSRRAFFVEQGLRSEELIQLWSKRDDISYGKNEGFWVGRESVIKNYVEYHAETCKADRKLMQLAAGSPVTSETNEMGGLEMHMVMSPLVEVATDMQTAKGMFYSIGIRSELRQDGQSYPHWHFERQAADFILEDGQWKIWHLFIGAEIILDFGETYIPGSGVRGDPRHKDPEPNPEVAAAWNIKPKEPEMDVRAKMYDVISGFCPYPPVPLPYETFSKTFTYGPEPIIESGLSMY